MQRKLPKRLKNEKIETAHVTHVTIRKSNKIDPNIDNRMIHHSPKPDPVSFHNSSSIVLKRISSVDRERSPSITRTYPSDHFLTQVSHLYNISISICSFLSIKSRRKIFGRIVEI